MPRGHDGKVSRAVFHLLAVLRDHLHPAGDEVAGVRGLAAVGLGDRLDVFGPTPAGLEGGPAHRSAIEVDQLQPTGSVLEGADLFGIVEALSDQSRHL
jgi:hypothetical protein